MKTVVLVLDIGTSVVKCGSVTPSFSIIKIEHYPFPLEQKDGFITVDFEYVFQLCSELIRDVVAQTQSEGFQIDALLITSQAQTFVPVDEQFKPLMDGIVWLDRRAAAEAEYLTNELPDFAQTSGFYRPTPMMYISKLLWFKKYQPLIFQKATYFPLLNEFIAFRLTNVFYSEFTNFGMTGLLDIQKRVLNNQIVKILGLKRTQFPRLEKACAKGYSILLKLRKKLNIEKPISVYLAANDQGASACGAGVERPSDVNLNCGTAMVFYTIIKKMPMELEPNQIVGIDPFTDDFFFLSYESNFGLILNRIKQKYFAEQSFDELFSSYYQAGDSDKFMKITTTTDSIFSESNENYEQSTGAVIKHYLKRFKYHLSSIENITIPDKIFVSGGFVRSKAWFQILQENCKYELISSVQQHAGVIGAAKIFKNRNHN